jgi:hypothetical protein
MGQRYVHSLEQAYVLEFWDGNRENRMIRTINLMGKQSKPWQKHLASEFQKKTTDRQ